jgi:D-alanyl-lipoteichoic acid acyltransferase DltB (MBOAT superfamily)
MKIAAFSSPLKYKISEKIRELKAEINNNMSVIVNFFKASLSILRFILSNNNIGFEVTKT